jgi:hypothetical protein
MKVITDDPDWARDMYEARALAVLFVTKYGRVQASEPPCKFAERGGLTVTYHPSRSPVLLTVDASESSAAPSARVLSVEWNDGDAWRVAIETYHRGRWQSRLKAMVHPRPWLERWRAVAMFTARPPKATGPERVIGATGKHNRGSPSVYPGPLRSPK